MKSPNSSTKLLSACTRRCPSLSYSPVGRVKAGVLGAIRPRIAGWFVSKGRQVYVEGRLTTREYEAKDGSGKRYRTEIIARPIRFLDRKPGAAKSADAPCVPTRCQTGLSRRRWKHRGPQPAETLPREAAWSVRRVEIGEAKRKAQFNTLIDRCLRVARPGQGLTAAGDSGHAGKTHQATGHSASPAAPGGR